MYRLEMPQIDRASQRAVILRWHKAVGDPIAFGDEIADIMVKVLHKEVKLSFLGKLAGRFSGKQIDIYHKKEYRRIVAADTGILRTIETEPGHDLPIGALMAILTDEVGEEIDYERLDEALTYRVRTRVIEPAG